VRKENDMTLLEEIQNGENAVLEFKEARPKDSLKFTKTVVAFANGRGGRIGDSDGNVSVEDTNLEQVQKALC
jgi:predicted HTH transcriptional regulator